MEPSATPPLFREDFRSKVIPFDVERPGIISGPEYYFETSSGLRYQVLFARKKESFLEHVVNFSVLNDEYEDEYSETNRGEVYRVIATVVEIVRIYHSLHPHNLSYEFCGEYKKGNESRENSIRSLLYFRKAREVIHPSWEIIMKQNRVTVRKKR